MKRLFPVILSVIVITLAITLLTFAPSLSATDYSAGTDYWWSYGDMYNLFDLAGTGNSLSATPTSAGYMNYNSAAGSATSSWYPVVAATPKRIIALDGSQIKFNLAQNMYFDNFNGYNGYVGFTWMTGCSSVADNYLKSITIPYTLYANTYNNSALGGDTWGGMARQFSNKGISGLTVSLFPDNAGGDINTCYARYIQVYCTTGATYKAALSSPVNLRQTTEISINRVSGTTYAVKINGSVVTNINIGALPTDAGFLSLSAMGSHYSSRTAFTITEINHYTPASYASPVYEFTQAVDSLPSASSITSLDKSNVENARTLYGYLNSTLASWVPSSYTDKLSACEEALLKTSDTGYALLGSSTVPVALSSAVTDFSIGNYSSMTLLDGAVLTTPITLSGSQKLILNSGSSAKSVSGTSGAQLYIADGAVCGTLDDSKIYVISGGAWKEAEYAQIQLRRADIIRNSTLPGGDTQSLIFGACINKNTITSGITDYGIIFIPSVATSASPDTISLLTPDVAVAHSSSSPSFGSSDRTTITAALTGIPANRYDTLFYARTYCTYAIGDTMITVYGGSGIIRSVSSVCSAILNGGDIFVAPEFSSVTYSADFKTAYVNYTEVGEFLKSSSASLTGFEVLTSSGVWTAASASLYDADTVAVTCASSVIMGVRYSSGSLTGGSGLAAPAFSAERDGALPDATATSFTVSKGIGNNMVIQRDKVITIWGWAPSSQNGKIVCATFKGLSGYAVVSDGQWKITLNGTLPADTTGATLTVYGNGVTRNYSGVLVGDVYFLIGQSNMWCSVQKMLNDASSRGYDYSSYISTSSTLKVRLFRSTTQDMSGDYVSYPSTGTNDIKADATISTGWQTPYSGAYNFSALGYVFGTSIFKNTGVPVGLMQVDGSGFSMAAFAPGSLCESWDIEEKRDGESIYRQKIVHTGSRFIYNQLINPIMNVSIAGMVWYQGETDEYNTAYSRGGDNTYVSQMADLIAYYRANMPVHDFPLFVVEFPSYYGNMFNFGNIRSEMGVIPLLIDNSYIAASGDVWTDSGFGENYHPYCKPAQAARVTSLVMSTIYNTGAIENVAGPQIESVAYPSSNTAVITYKYTGGGLKCAASSLKGFQVKTSSSSQTWRTPISATIIAPNQVKVTYDSAIYGVRYHIENSTCYPSTINLASGTGIPALAFADYKNTIWY